MKNNKPVIRFKGFSEEWEERRMGEIAAETYGGGTPKTTEQSYWNGNIPWFQSSDLSESKISGVIPRKHISDEGLKTSATKLIPSNSIAIITRVGVGKLALMPFAYATSQDFLSLSNMNIDESFGVYAIYKKIQGELNAVQGTSIKGITKDELLSKSFSVPKQPAEQTQIGNFFKNLDNLITLHQRKYEKLGTLKKAMLEKMFPKNGANVPEIRFKGFEGAWEEKTLGEMCVIGDIDHRMPESVKDGIPYIMTGSFVGINDIDFEDSKLISIEDYEQLSKKIKPELGDILFARYASVGAVRYVETQIKFLVSYSCTILKNNSTFSSKYLFYYLQSNETQRQIELEINTGSQRNIGIDSLKKLIIFLPQDKEQEKIGNYFKNLDDLLKLHEGELAKLKNLKKALLEKMFV